MFGQGFNSGFFGGPSCFTDTTDIFKDNSGLALYTLDYDASDAGGNYDGTPSNVAFGVDGQINYGTSFNDSAITTSLNIGRTNDFTISFWVKDISNSNYGSYDFKWIVGVYNNDYIPIFYNKTSGKIEYHIHDGTTALGILETSALDDNWHHIVFTQDVNVETKLYVDGVLQTSETVSHTSMTQRRSVSGGTGFYFGQNPSNSSNDLRYRGRLDQVRIFNKALSNSEATALYGETACVYTATTDTINYQGTNLAYYKFDNTTEDETGNHDGTGYNLSYTFGRFGQCADFNGLTSSSGTYISVPHNTSFSWKNNKTLSLWFKLDSYLSGSRGLAAKGDGGSGPYGWYLYKNGTDNKIGFSYYDSAINIATLVTNNAVDLNTWYHLCITTDGTTDKLYLNGEEEDSTSSIVGIDINTPLVIGRFYSNYTDYNIDGQIDQFRFYESTLNSTQVTKLYNEKPEIDISNFKTALYEGTGSTRYISNVGIQPGLVWIKSRSSATSNFLFDVIRGGSNWIATDLTLGQNVASGVTSFEANGFDLGINGSMNGSGADYVAWCWKGSDFKPSQTFSNIKTQGLIAHWNATQSDSLYYGSTWYDLTSNNRDLTHYTTSVSSINIGNNNGGVINMNSTDQFYTPQFINDQTFTIGGWYRRDAFGSAGYENLWAQGYSPSVRLQIYGSGGTSTGDRIYHYLHNGSSGNSYNTGIDAPKGVWFHIMVAYDLSNGTVKLYLNGALAHTATTITGSIYSAGNYDTYFRVTRNSTNNNGYINGAISQLRAYSDVLTDAEVLNDYNATKGLFQSNNEGTISATVDANTEAGFSIVKWVGTETSITVGHGLSSTPEMLIVKNTVDDINWFVWNKDLGGGNKLLKLNKTDGVVTRTNQFDSTVPTSTVFSVGAHNGTNGSGDTMIAYCWHSVAGYSKIGSYSGSGISGKEVTLDFNPSFVLIKRINANAGWVIVDDKRGTKELYPHLSNQEDTTTANIVLGTNKFTLNSTGSWYNASGGTYLYMAFK